MWVYYNTPTYHVTSDELTATANHKSLQFRSPFSAGMFFTNFVPRVFVFLESSLLTAQA